MAYPFWKKKGSKDSGAGGGSKRAFIKRENTNKLVYF